VATRDQQKISFYRRHVQALHVLRRELGGRRRMPYFLAELTESEGVYCWDAYEAPDFCFCSDACKDHVVERIRALCQPEAEDEPRIVAIWLATDGWTAPADGRRPSRHPRRQHGLLLFESAATKDSGGFLPDGETRWEWSPSGPDDRFVNLIGRTTLKPELRVVASLLH